MLPLLAVAGIVLDAVLIGMEFLGSEPGQSQIETFIDFQPGMDFAAFMGQTWLVWFLIVGVFWFLVVLANPVPDGRRRRR